MAIHAHRIIRRSILALFISGRLHLPARTCQQKRELASHAPTAFRLYTKSHIPKLLAQYAPNLDAADYRASAEVFPMRADNYVVDELIDWSDVPNDPIFQLVFPQPDMLQPKDRRDVLRALSQQVSKVELRSLAESIREMMNPHPAGQKEENVPIFQGTPMNGMQHKYGQTVLFFPSEGQFCHSFCTYCFRWAQFTSVGSDQQFQSKSSKQLVEYIAHHKNITDVLFTGGDPMVMTSQTLAKYIQPLLHDERLSHLASVRIGTKSLAYWPYRYTSDPDAQATLQLFSDVVKSGRQLTIQAHFSHPRELSTPAVQEAMRLIRMTGANIRCQSPLINHVNNAAELWTEMWNLQVRLGAIPYYMFVERDTGASHYFSVSLHDAYKILSKAYSQLSGTARTVRGPSMSASPGKVGVVGVEEIAGERVFVLRFFQARKSSWTNRVFFAQFDPNAVWLNQLRPAFGEREFFFEKEYESLKARAESSGQIDTLDAERTESSLL